MRHLILALLVLVGAAPAWAGDIDCTVTHGSRYSPYSNLRSPDYVRCTTNEPRPTSKGAIDTIIDRINEDRRRRQDREDAEALMRYEAQLELEMEAYRQTQANVRQLQQDFPTIEQPTVQQAEAVSYDEPSMFKEDRICHTDGQRFTSDYRFCPLHGRRLHSARPPYKEVP